MDELRITNRTTMDKRAVLEPWGEIYQLPPGHSIQFHFEGDPDDAVEVSLEANELKIWAPGGVVATVRDAT